jgi:hypothetical protein
MGKKSAAILMKVQLDFLMNWKKFIPDKEKTVIGAILNTPVVCSP